MEIGFVEGDERAILAEQMFIYKIKAYVGNYAAQLGGLDAICFTGGIGENAAGVRAGVVEGLEFMGVKINPEVNNVRKKGTVDLSAADSKVKVFKIQTNEELAIARDTFEIVTKL